MKRRITLPVFPGLSDPWFQPDLKDFDIYVRGALSELIGPFETNYWLYRLVLGFAEFSTDLYKQKAAFWLTSTVSKQMAAILPSIEGVSDTTYTKDKLKRLEGDLNFSSLRELMADVNSTLKDQQAAWNAHLEMHRRTSRKAVQPLLAAGSLPYSPIGMSDGSLSFLLDFATRTVLSEDDLRQLFVSDFCARWMPALFDLFPVDALGEKTKAKVDSLLEWLALGVPASRMRLELETIFAGKK